MSHRDYQKYGSSLPKLVGRRCFATLAANSLKLHLDENCKGGVYLWFDPPWRFTHLGKVIQSSLTCPTHSETHYQARFSNWLQSFEPIFASEIQYIDAHEDGSLIVGLAHGYTLELPGDPTPADADSWYDHWYLNDPTAE